MVGVGLRVRVGLGVAVRDTMRVGVVVAVKAAGAGPGAEGVFVRLLHPKRIINGRVIAMNQRYGFVILTPWARLTFQRIGRVRLVPLSGLRKPA